MSRTILLPISEELSWPEETPCPTMNLMILMTMTGRFDHDRESQVYTSLKIKNTESDLGVASVSPSNHCAHDVGSELEPIRLGTINR